MFPLRSTFYIEDIEIVDYPHQPIGDNIEHI